MSTPQTVTPATSRLLTRPGTLIAALGVLVAIAVTIVILALTGAHHTTVPIPATASQAVASATPQVHYLGPRQQQAALHRTTTHRGTGHPAPHYTCLGAPQRCLR